MSDRDDDAKRREDDASKTGRLVGGIIKKAVSLGAGAYVTAEDTVNKTLGTVQIPKEMIREAIENFFESYTISINAEVKFNPKRKEDVKPTETGSKK